MRNGWLALQTVAATEQVAGVAWWAHIGGFAIGMIAGAFVRVFTPASVEEDSE